MKKINYRYTSLRRFPSIFAQNIPRQVSAFIISRNRGDSRTLSLLEIAFDTDATTCKYTTTTQYTLTVG